MAAYPSSPAYRTTITPATKNRVRTAESGVPRLSSLSEETAFRIVVVHPYITSSDVSTLQSFYAANQYGDNTIDASDGNTYDCWFEQDYEIEAVSGTYFHARTVLIANRQ